MSFLKDFKEDLSLAVSELLPQDMKEENVAQAEENSLKEIKENKEIEPEQKHKAEEPKEKNRSKNNGKKNKKAEEKTLEQAEPEELQIDYEELEKINESVEAEKTMDEILMENLGKEMEDFNDEMKNETQEEQTETAQADTKTEQKNSNAVTTITEGTRICGDIESDGSLEILGTITGNVICNGKLTVTGTIIGDSKADEIYADSAKIEGEINSAGAVKIGVGSVILGNVNATSAVIAGAIRGDIDVHGPVIVDTSAVVMGNIKSRSVQINNGAVIEGFCSQCYSDVSVKNFFEENKPSEQKK